MSSDVAHVADGVHSFCIKWVRSPSFRWSRGESMILWCGSVKPSPAALIRAAFIWVRFPHILPYQYVKPPIKGGFSYWWSRGESNPCPKATWKDFLRAQSVIYIPSSRREQTHYGNQ